MAIEQDFSLAVEAVKTLPERPGNDTLLALYGLYKQATEGDVSGPRPGMLDMKGRKKFDAWAEKKGQSKADAMTAYVALVNKLRNG